MNETRRTETATIRARYTQVGRAEFEYADIKTADTEMAEFGEKSTEVEPIDDAASLFGDAEVHDWDRDSDEESADGDLLLLQEEDEEAESIIKTEVKWLVSCYTHHHPGYG